MYSLGIETLHKITSLKAMEIRNCKIEPWLFDSKNQKPPLINYFVLIGDQIFLDTQTIQKDILIKLTSREQVEGTMAYEESADILASMQVYFTFVVDDLAHFITYSKSLNEPIINKELNTWLNNVIIATSRGIIFDKLQDTIIKSSVLPLINPNDLANH